MWYVCAHWVPHMLTKEQLQNRVKNVCYGNERFMPSQTTHQEQILETDDWFTVTILRGNKKFPFGDTHSRFLQKKCARQNKLLKPCYCIFQFWDGFFDKRDGVPLHYTNQYDHK